MTALTTSSFVDRATEGAHVALHVIYRSCGPEGAKPRPEIYSKLLALESLIAAADMCEPGSVELIFFNDGPIPEPRLSRMHEAGEVVAGNFGSNRPSYRAALTIPRARHWPHDDVVLFAEDDYLYRQEALTELLSATRTVSAQYFFPYAEHVNVMPHDERTGALRWVPHDSTTSTFAVRVSALQRDERILRFCPYTGGAWDRASMLAVAGTPPFPHDAEEFIAVRPRFALARAGVRLVTRTVLRIWVRGRRLRGLRHTAVAAEPALATHLELGHLASGTDWASLAASVRANSALL